MITFPAIRGKMGDRDFFLVTMSLRQLARTLDPTPDELPAEQRAQRSLNERRVPDITRYLIDRENDWVFGSLTVSFDGESEFQPVKDGPEGVGVLTLSPDTVFVIVDGQHRLAAIQQALKENVLLGRQRVGVMFIPFEDLDRNQQVFSDLNRTVQKTSRSLDILYNHADPLNGVVLAMTTRVPLFKKKVEKDSQSLALRSPKLVTLSSLYDGCRELLGGERLTTRMSESAAGKAEAFCVAYWIRLTKLIEPWRQVADGEIKPSEARTEYVVTHSVAFHALGTAGALLLEISSQADWSARKASSRVLEGLSGIDWEKTNPDWQGIVMLGQSVVTRRQTRAAMARYICHKVDPERFPKPQPVLEVDG
jgi:DNA sulfur modification protein DndB